MKKENNSPSLPIAIGTPQPRVANSFSGGIGGGVPTHKPHHARTVQVETLPLGGRCLPAGQAGRGLLVLILTIVMIDAFAYKMIDNTSGKKPSPSSNFKTLSGDCEKGSAQTELNINNVRARIYNVGDMWWDFPSGLPVYEVPKNSGLHSLFASALWIGGVDAGGQLKVAAMTYRQGGVDFWPGPLGTSTSISEVDKTTCKEYDKIFMITREEVEKFALNPTPENLTAGIANWKGSGNTSLNQENFLAPFFDADADDRYDPNAGDYPGYDLQGTNATCTGILFGDQTAWWVFNDKGNIHTESGAQAIGLQINAQAFAFNTSDEINDMTFYNYTLLNRSSFTLNKTYIGQWADPDIGVATDDFVGCDVGRGLGYCYNGYAEDGTTGGATGQSAYGANPPAAGLDFFKGPKADANDGIDNNRNGVVDEVDEEIIMSKFLYYNNALSTVYGDPRTGSDFYYYLSGFWKNGQPFTYGENGLNASNIVCDFMFPGDSDPTGWGTAGIPQPAWDEFTSGNTPADRRFVQSAGPFTLQPGAVNTITIGAVWARATTGGNLASIALLKVADDKAQALFNNCFKVLNGPDAPDVTVQELDREIILMLSNKTSSNNYLETYNELDPLIIPTPGLPDPLDDTYDFQGYNIFQLKDESVSITDVLDPDKARLVAHCDIKDSVTGLINFQFDSKINGNVGTEWVSLASENVNIKYDRGIRHSFRITEDQFATGNTKLINHKTYYFMALAYGYNNYKTYRQDAAPDTANVEKAAYDGQKLPYKGGRKNIKVYSAIPHNSAPESGGTKQSASYGSGVKLTRIEGQGNGGNVLDFTQATIDAILNSPDNRVLTPEYEAGRGPVNIKVVDPLNVGNAEYELKFTGVSATSGWVLWNKTANVYVNSLEAISVGKEQIIPEWGLSITVNQVKYNPGDNAATIPASNSAGAHGAQPDEVYSYLDHKNGFLEASITFSDPSKTWLTGVADVDGYSGYNWIRSGTQVDKTGADGSPELEPFNDHDYAYSGSKVTGSGIDNLEEYEKVLEGTWAPYRLGAYTDQNLRSVAGPSMGNQSTLNATKMYHLASVDVVITSDQTKWTRCPVIELQEEVELAEGGAKKLAVRNRASIDKNGSTGDGVDSGDPNDADYINPIGMSWFPGYAINLETGERLNMAFGEDSWLANENGRDMKWNPTSTEMAGTNYYAFGGKHYIYVFGHNTHTDGANTAATFVPAYDKGAFIRNKLTPTGNTTTDNNNRRDAYRDAMWVTLPLLVPGRTLLETDVKIRLRVAKTYMKGYSTGSYNFKPTGTSGFINPPLDTAGQPGFPVAQNNNYPMYTFSTADVATITDDKAAAETSLMDMVNVVPNPYYAYSNYETSQLDTRVKITNLPEKCTISIYSVNGGLIRRFIKSDDITSLDWDLKNHAGVPVAGGLYLIHINVPDVGEKVIRWFGVMRPPDLENY